MDGLAVRVVNGDHSAQMTLVLRRTMGKNVTLGGVSTFDGAAGTHLKALGGSLFRFHLRHLTDFLLLLDDHRRFCTLQKTCRPDLTCYKIEPLFSLVAMHKMNREEFSKRMARLQKRE